MNHLSIESFHFTVLRIVLCTDYQVVVNLHREGTVISSRETEQVSSAVWNSSFLFDLPPGDISQLPLTLQYIIVQVKKQLNT